MPSWSRWADPGGGYFAGPDKKQIRGYPNRLFRNLGGWQFKDVTAARVARPPSTSWCVAQLTVGLAQPPCRLCCVAGAES
jgi:hypothetical protein